MTGWELFAPPGEAQFGWLDEIREFRARVLYDNGRRPAFRQGDGRYADSDRRDRAAHHLSARVAGVMAGCVRLLPVPDGDVCFTEQLVGPARFAEILSDLGVDRSQTIEGGRWVVDPTYRAGRTRRASRRRWSGSSAGAGIPDAVLPGGNRKKAGSGAGPTRLGTGSGRAPDCGPATG